MWKMLFNIFNSQSERKKFGGSAFIEFQFCRLPSGTAISEIVAVDNIKDWQTDSLYVNDENMFYREYVDIFSGGTYNNLQKGVVDIYGINYYSPSLLDLITKRISDKMPTDYEILLKWLNKSEKYNGFYILGI